MSYITTGLVIVSLAVLAYGITRHLDGFSKNMAPPPVPSEEIVDPGIFEHLSGPGPADLSPFTPYHLLADRFPPHHETLSCVNSRSCYATDFEEAQSKTGNYRQLTNNYKREAPDHCSAPRQELVLSFYKMGSQGSS